MRFQPDSYSCGIFAVLNAADILGKRLRTASIKRYSQTSKKFGTSELGIKRSLLNHDLNFYEFEVNDFEVALRILETASHEKKPVILCVDKWDHWLVFYGFDEKKRFLFLDSLNTSRNKRNNGKRILNKTRFKKFWCNKGTYYGIVVFG